MPIINVTHLSKDFQVYKHHRGLAGAFRNLFTREFRTVNAVSEVSFSIERGELVGYLGPNGAGKSTTIKMLTGILVPTRGEISVNGRVPWRERAAHAGAQPFAGSADAGRPGRGAFA
jgi:ABC-2 type transport system ATP-binding protein